MKQVQYFASATRQPDGSYKHVIENIKLFEQQFAELISRGADKVEYEVTFQRLQVDKTYEQLKYFKGIIRRLLLQGFRDIGYDMGNVEEAENAVKMLFYYRDIANKDGEPVRVPKSLVDASKEELHDFIDECREFSQEFLNTHIMSPSDYVEYLINEQKNLENQQK